MKELWGKAPTQKAIDGVNTPYKSIFRKRVRLTLKQELKLMLKKS